MDPLPIPKRGVGLFTQHDVRRHREDIMNRDAVRRRVVVGVDAKSAFNPTARFEQKRRHIPRTNSMILT